MAQWKRKEKKINIQGTKQATRVRSEASQHRDVRTRASREEAPVTGLSCSRSSCCRRDSRPEQWHSRSLLCVGAREQSPAGSRGELSLLLSPQGTAGPGPARSPRSRWPRARHPGDSSHGPQRPGQGSTGTAPGTAGEKRAMASIFTNGPSGASN